MPYAHKQVDQKICLNLILSLIFMTHLVLNKMNDVKQDLILKNLSSIDQI